MNLFDNIVPQSGEDFTLLLEHRNVKINRIISSANVDSVEYCQDEDEWLVLLEGAATLLVGSDEVMLKKGDTFFIPALMSHRVIKVEHGTIWLTIHW